MVRMSKCQREREGEELRSERERTESFVGLEVRTNTNPPNQTNIKDFYTELKLCHSNRVDGKVSLGKYTVSNSGRVNKEKLQ
jgi:hypothetical protein